MLKKLFLPLLALTLLGGAFLASNPANADDPCEQFKNQSQAYDNCIKTSPDHKQYVNKTNEEKFNNYKCSGFTSSQLKSCDKINDPTVRSNCSQCKALKDTGYNGPNNEWAAESKTAQIVDKCKTAFEKLSGTNPSQYQLLTNGYAEGAKSQWLQDCYKKNGLTDEEAKKAITDHGTGTYEYRSPIVPGTDGQEDEEEKDPINQPDYDEYKEGYSVPNTSPTIESDCRPFLGMVSWDCNTHFQNVTDEEGISQVVVMIAINIFTDITVLASYLVIGYIIYGGYLYIFANGDVGKVATGKKALNQAFIGLAITLSAHIIVNAIRVAFMHNSGSFEACATETCVDADTLVSGLIQWVVGIGGAVAAAFVVGGGIMYITSAGDPNKLQLAKNIIKYALIGLVIVALAEIITGFMTNVIVDAKNNSESGEETSYINNIKEYYENQKVS